MKRANHSTQLKGSAKGQQPPEAPPAPPAGKRDGDARGDQGQLVENQQELGVGEDHKTEDMEEGGRGTFP
jgi:hypothetical protein